MIVTRLVTGSDPESILTRLGVPPCPLGHPNPRMERVTVGGIPSPRGHYLRCPCRLTMSMRYYKTLAEQWRAMRATEQKP